MTKSILALIALATSAYAQNAVIASPSAGSTLRKGQSFTVEIARPEFPAPSKDVSVVIGLQTCVLTDGSNSTDCSVLTQTFGFLLYSGDYTPTGHPDAPQGTFEDYQNFTFTVPTNIPTGQAQVKAAHLYLTGAGFIPVLEQFNVTVNVVN
ncbi:hypothetical protein EIP91_010565 [Steccherinum ochraceum]|uniref:Phosphatidylglycerol/phosphatidylinositol transfer protein n=1 Tax=Steccherinum ochraceum TaxID=92696 RepID=A0A4R0RSN1_9APHY|nr:hypothetical protein EIP91_010565 [Steccherinum ochraceum]